MLKIIRIMINIFFIFFLVFLINNDLRKLFFVPNKENSNWLNVILIIENLTMCLELNSVLVEKYQYLVKYHIISTYKAIPQIRMLILY